MQGFKQFWFSVTRSKYVVFLYTTFLAGLGTQIQSAYATGHLDFTVAGWEHMVMASGLFTVYALAHLYAPAPGASPNPPTTSVK